MSSAASDKRDAVPDRESGNDQRQAPQRCRREQQADQKKHVVRANQDVLDTRRDERPDHRPPPLRRPGKEPHGRRVGGEDALLA